MRYPHTWQDLDTAECGLLSDVELVFLYPWAVVAKSMGWMALIEIVIFFFILFIGFLYAHRKGALKWM